MSNQWNSRQPEPAAIESHHMVVGDRSASDLHSKSRGPIPSLRPPTLMIDLLFGALMLFALHMGNPNSQQIIPKTFDLPTANDSASKDRHELAALKPVKSADGHWRYEITSGRRLSATEVKAWAKKGRKTPVLVVAKSISVQDYLDAEEPLRKQGLKVGLAVELESEVTK